MTGKTGYWLEVRKVPDKTFLLSLLIFLVSNLMLPTLFSLMLIKHDHFKVLSEFYHRHRREIEVLSLHIAFYFPALLILDH